MGNLPIRPIIRLAITSAAFIVFWMTFVSSKIINNHYFHDNLRRMAYLTAIPYGPLQCGMLCTLEGRCAAVNYHMESLTCELVETSASDVSDSDGWVSTSDFSFVKDLLGSCASVNIDESNSCVRLRNGGNAIIVKHCPVPTAVLHANVTFDKRTVGDIIEYTCDDCYYSSGGSTATCLSDGQWSSVNVQCTSSSTVADIRLVGGNHSAGRIEILYGGTWGTICDDGWDNPDAAVVCRQLGYSGGQVTVSAYFGEGSGTIWMDDVICSGNECMLSACNFPGWGVENCAHSEDAGVICIGN
ncbi:scavenger receptor cysteine-rich domain superfamily protein-like [Mizuhopecten yessoensis]|uniref:Galectin-3-binding protein A n=1 Tax=Mizuhopecten yessoensis TaxID=6573 RepID=A0A210PLJ5_MIZYE|nr:scavenger receptor cysteine-rich domain superfamily protein-like [Mizuhopecten yessoensis]OWF37368.1 Galectin-3-binding protein A [Mizuhopecten yessoensis]